MCEKPKLKKGSSASRIDPCFKQIISTLNHHKIKTLACCCGHGKYPPTIVFSSLGGSYEMFSGKYIPRKKRFYRRDEQGYYYIPEVLDE